MEEKKDLSMQQILETIPKDVAFYKGDLLDYRYNIIACKSKIECLKHYIPGIHIEDYQLERTIYKNLYWIDRKQIPEFDLSKYQLVEVGQKRIDHFMHKRSGFVFENPKVFKQKTLNEGYKLSFNENSQTKQAPKTLFEVSTFKARSFIEDHKDILYDDVMLSYMANTLTKKYGEIYPVLYSLYYVNMFSNFAKLKGMVLYGHASGLERKLALIGKKSNNIQKIIANGIERFDYFSLQDIPAKDYDNENS